MWVVLVASLLVQTTASFGNQAISPLAPFLLADLGLSKTGLGLVVSAFYLGAVLMLTPSGWASDRLGVRRMFLVGLLGVGVPLLLAAQVALLPLLGCAGTKATPSTSQGKLEEVREMLKTLQSDKAKPPAKAADLGAVEPYLPTSAADLRSGEIVYVWGAGLSGGNAVIAYDKKAPTDGGWVLLQDGTVKQMSAAEFSSAPKAK